MKLPRALSVVLPGLVAVAACMQPALPVVTEGAPVASPSSPVAGVSAPPPASSPAASALASTGAPAVVSAPAESRPALPPAPLPIEAEGAAAIVWVEDDTAEDRIRSTWIEPDGAGAKVVARRSGKVFVGRRELWVLAHREVKIKNQRCGAGTSCNDGSETPEPYLKSLASGRAQLPSPWHREIRDSLGCAHTAEVMVEGSVGTVGFARIGISDMACGAQCPMHRGALATFDVDTGKPVKLAFPPGIVAPLREHLLSSMADQLQSCPKLPLYRATAAYNAGGVLEGVYEFGDDQVGLCAGAPSCPNPTERVAWVPEKLAPWGKLPAWVASFLAMTRAETALLIPAARLAASRKQFERDTEAPRPGPG